jgi:hypothetical protein
MSGGRIFFRAACAWGGAAVAAVLMMGIGGCGKAGTSSPTLPATESGVVFTIRVGAGSSIAFQPSAVIAKRQPANCAAIPTSYAPSDLISLSLAGHGPSGQSASGGLAITFYEDVQTAAAIAFGPLPYTFDPNPNVVNDEAAIAQSGSHLKYFQLLPGNNPTEIDEASFQSVAVTFAQLPQKDGDNVVVSYQVTFTDGATLDETLTAPVYTDSSDCLH